MMMNVTHSRRRMLGLLAAALAPLPAGAQASKIRIGASPTESSGEPFFGLDSGLFEKFGLDVDLTFFSNSSQIVVAASGGAVDVGIADPIQLGSAINRGLPFAFFAGGSQYNTLSPTTMFCVDKSGPIQSAKDLEGKTIGVVALNSVSSLSVLEWLHQSGVEQSAVKMFEMPLPTMGAALARGTIGGAHISEPFLSAAKNDVRIIGKPYDSIAKGFYINSWFATRDWLAKDTAEGRRLAQAIYAVAHWANAHHDASAPILSKYTKMELDRIHAMTRATFATSLDSIMMQPVLDLAWRYRYIDKPLVAQNIMVQVAG